MRRLLSCFAGLLCFATVLHGASARWVTNNTVWNSDGQVVTWYRNDVSYSTDAGPLSVYVTHAQAVDIVDAAAAVWNIPYSNLVLANGGTLNEDVSSANVYLGSNGPIWPADVDSSNYQNKQIAVLFDADGTLIDMVLGSGASAPSSCRDNAAVESVDRFIQPGNIAHAVILLNGRCTGPAPEQQLQLRYQLMRIFGRVIGLGWSQVNDNVFTASPSPSYQQQLHWPIMHPIDVICGAYTYQCLPNPFTLREDDRSAVHLLYGTNIFTPSEGAWLQGYLTFPTGQGMDGVNMVAVRESSASQYGTEGWETTSAVTGYSYKVSNGNPVSGAPSGFPAVQGSWYPPRQGFWTMAQVPVIDNSPWDNVLVTPEAINPLYKGRYAVGPTGPGVMVPSGAAATITFTVVGRVSAIDGSATVATAASDCSTGSDGTEAAPAAVAGGGVWTGRLCDYGHTSWGSFAVQAGRTATLEAMALDENSAASTGKLRPVLGLWHGGSATGTRPTLAAAATPFNGRQNGTTQLTAAFSAAETVRFVIADERGNGRPDFNYGARLLYADSVAPGRVGESGGTVRIDGTGFQPGNTVTVGGVRANVISLTANQIVFTAPTLAAIGGASTNDVTVTDLRTGGTTTITGGLLYGSSTGDALAVVQAPPASVAVGAPAPFQVRLTDSTSTPVAGVTVTFRVTAGSAALAPCGAATCTMATDNTGLAAVQVTPSAAGTVTLLATTGSGAQATVQFSAAAVAQSIAAARTTEYVLAGTAVPLHPAAVVVANGSRAPGVPVQWTVSAGNVTLALTQTTSGPDGTTAVAAFANVQAGGTATVQGCAWTSVCAATDLVGVSANVLGICAVSGDAQVVNSGSRLGSLVLRVIDNAGNGVAGAPVTIAQKVTGWQPACPANGRCAVPPVYGTSTSTLISDDDGLVTVVPLQYDGAAADTKIVAATGPNGYIALTLSKMP